MDAHLTGELGAYRNLAAFLEHRRYSVDREGLRPPGSSSIAGGLTEMEVVKGILVRLGMWELIGSRPAADGGGEKEIMTILLLQSEGKYAHAAQNFKLLLSSTKSKAKAGEKLTEVLILVSEEVLKKKHLQESLKEFQKGMPGVYFSMRPYYMFAKVLPETAQVPHHEVISKEEATDFMRRFHYTKEQLPILNYATDPMAVWCGARPGDYVRVLRPSRTAAAHTEVVRITR